MSLHRSPSKAPLNTTGNTTGKPIELVKVCFGAERQLTYIGVAPTSLHRSPSEVSLNLLLQSSPKVEIARFVWQQGNSTSNTVVPDSYDAKG